LLVEVRADNNDSAGGPNSIPVPAEGDKNACNYGSYFWGSNNITQRNLSYGSVPAGAAAQIEFAFLASNFQSPARFVEVTVDKGKELARVPMTLTMEPVYFPNDGDHRQEEPCCCDREYIILTDTKLIIKCGKCEILELEAKGGTVLKEKCPEKTPSLPTGGTSYGAVGDGKTWQLLDTLSTVGFPRSSGEVFKMKLSFITPTDLQPGTEPIIRIYQRNDHLPVITGGVSLQLTVPKTIEMQAAKKVKRARRKTRAR